MSTVPAAELAASSQGGSVTSIAPSRGSSYRIRINSGVAGTSLMICEGSGPTPR